MCKWSAVNVRGISWRLSLTNFIVCLFSNYPVRCYLAYIVRRHINCMAIACKRQTSNSTDHMWCIQEKFNMKYINCKLFMKPNGIFYQKINEKLVFNQRVWYTELFVPRKCCFDISFLICRSFCNEFCNEKKDILLSNYQLRLYQVTILCIARQLTCHCIRNFWSDFIIKVKKVAQTIFVIFQLWAEPISLLWSST